MRALPELNKRAVSRPVPCSQEQLCDPGRTRGPRCSSACSLGVCRPVPQSGEAPALRSFGAASCSTVILNAVNQESLRGASGTHSQSACRGRPWDSARSSRRDPGETWSPQPWGKGKRAQISSRVRRAGEKLVPAPLATSDFEDCRMRPGQHLKAHSARQVTLRSEEAGGPIADRSRHEKGLTSADCCLVGLSEGPDFLIFQEKLKIQISCEIC